MLHRCGVFRVMFRVSWDVCHINRLIVKVRRMPLFSAYNTIPTKYPPSTHDIRIICFEPLQPLSLHSRCIGLGGLLDVWNLVQPRGTPALDGAHEEVKGETSHTTVEKIFDAVNCSCCTVCLLSPCDTEDLYPASYVLCCVDVSETLFNSYHHSKTSCLRSACSSPSIPYGRTICPGHA